MASAVAGYKTSFGADGPPNSYADIDEANCIFLIGTNTADCHPVIFKRIKQRKLSAPDNVTIICVDPRRTETADFADLHLPIRPGTDIALLNAMLYVLLDENLHRPRVYRRDTPTVSPSFWSFIKDYSPKTVEAICGIPECLIVEAALIFGKSAKALVALEHGRQPKQRRRAQEQRDSQFASGHRQDRQARLRAVLAHRPAQRHGRQRSRRLGAYAARLSRCRERRAAQ